MYVLFERANYDIIYYFIYILSDKYNVEKKEIDICKIIDYVMVINNSLEIIEMKCPSQLDEFVKMDLEKIKIASKNIEELITKIIKK